MSKIKGVDIPFLHCKNPGQRWIKPSTYVTYSNIQNVANIPTDQFSGTKIQLKPSLALKLLRCPYSCVKKLNFKEINGSPLIFLPPNRSGFCFF